MSTERDNGEVTLSSGTSIRTCRISVVPDKAELLRRAQENIAAWQRSRNTQPPGVRGDVLKHLAALKKSIDRTRTLDDRSAESGSSWQSPELESDIEAADRALKFLYELFDVPEVLP